MKKLHIDLETYSSEPIDKTGMYKYVQSDDFEILLLAYSLDDAPVQIIDLAQSEEIPNWLHEALESHDYLKYAYNAAFEWCCLSKYFKGGGILPINQWRDTMLHGLYCGYTAGLDATGKAMGLDEDKRKISTGKALIRYFCIPCNPTKTNGGRTRNLPHHDFAKWDLFKEYCIGDVVTEMEIEKKLTEFPVPDDVQKQWETDVQINFRGVKADLEFVHGALDIANKSREALIKEAIEITGLENPNSVAQLSNWLKTEIKTPLSDLKKDTVSKILAQKLVSGKAERILQIRQELGKTSTKKYDAIETAACKDNRIRGLIQFYGANRTGRYAGRLVQVQNLPRTYIDTSLLPLARDIVKKRESEKLNLLFGSINNTLSQLIRTAFVAAKGKIFVDADFSSIEARIVAWLAHEEWVLDVFKTHGKIYEATASQMFNIPIDRIKKGNPEYALRQRGKVATLGLSYGGGVGALKAMGALDMGIPEDDLQDIVDKWRQANPNIVKLWYAVENAVISVITKGTAQCVNGLIFSREIDTKNNLDFMTIQLPSKRKLYYVNPSLDTDGIKQVITYEGVNQTTKQWTTLLTYGAKIVENVVQAIARDCLALTIERLENAGYPIVFHVHDEVVIECDKDKANLDKIIEIMTLPISWAKDLPLNADGWTGEFFRKD